MEQKCKKGICFLQIDFDRSPLEDDTLKVYSNNISLVRNWRPASLPRKGMFRIDRAREALCSFTI
jgi:hypothetical protein